MSPVKPPEPNTDKATSVKETVKGIVRRVMSKKALAARSRSRSILGENYQTLRLTCTELPTTGRVARSRILQAGYMRIRALEERVRHLQARLGGPPPSSPGTARRTPRTVRRTDHRPCASPGPRYHYGHGSLLTLSRLQGWPNPQAKEVSSTQQTPGVVPNPQAKEVSSTQQTPGVVPNPQAKEVAYTQLNPEVVFPSQKSKWCGRALRPVLVHLDNQVNVHIKSEGHIWQKVHLSRREAGFQLPQKQSGSHTMR